MTLNELAYAQAELQGKSDDHTFIERMKFTIINYRALLIRRDVVRNTTTSRQYQQSFTINSFEFHDQTDSERSRIKLPVDVRLANSNGINRVQGEDSGNVYYPCSLEGIRYIAHSKFSKEQLRYFISEGYLHLYPCEDDLVRVSGIFQDPREVPGYQGDDAPFPIPADMAQQIVQAVLSTETSGANKDDNEVKIDG
jgi:hypothetical protein